MRKDLLMILLVVLANALAAGIVQATPSNLIPLGTGTCHVTSHGYDGPGTFQQAFEDASEHLCGWDKVYSIPSSAKVTIDLRAIPFDQQYFDAADMHDISMSNYAPNFNYDPFVSLPEGMARTLYIRGNASAQVNVGCVNIVESMDIQSLAFNGGFHSRYKTSFDDEPELCANDYYFHIWTFNPVRFHTLYFNPASEVNYTNTSTSTLISDTCRPFKAAIAVPPFNGESGEQITFSEIFIDLTEKKGCDVKPPIDGLHLPANGNVKVERLIVGFDQTSGEPIRYIADDASPTASPIPAPQQVRLLRTGNTLTLTGNISSGIKRIEAYRPPRTTVLKEYWMKYRLTKSSETLNWEQMKADKIFLEWKNPDPTKSATFALGDLPIYTMQDFSACEWEHCNTSSNPNACAFGRGYVVTAYDMNDRPSMMVVTKSYDDTNNDLKTIRNGCGQSEQYTDPKTLTDADCGDSQHVVNNLCVPVTCDTNAIAINHQCQTCPASQTAKENQCITKTCPSGQTLKDSGQCAAIQCQVGEMLQGNTCICDAAHGYSKDWRSGQCVHTTTTQQKSTDEHSQSDTQQHPTSQVTGDDFSTNGCGPGLVQYGTFCIQPSTCPSGTARQTPLGACTPAGGGFNAINTFQSMLPTGFAQDTTPPSGGGCSLIR